MRLGATLVHLGDGDQHPTAEWARRLVDAGFDSLWTPQIVGRRGMGLPPGGTNGPFVTPTVPNGPFVPDPFVTLAVAAAVTADVEIGTATVQVPLHHPVALAHTIASLHAACGDRLTLGLSPGSTADDYALLDRPFASRFTDFRTSVARLRTLLPAPPPLLLGSWGANVERAARDFDGWIAADHRRSAAEIVSALLRFRAAGGGRAIVCAVRCTSADLGPVADRLRTYAEAGFDDAVVVIEPGGPAPEAVRALLP